MMFVTNVDLINSWWKNFWNPSFWNESMLLSQRKCFNLPETKLKNTLLENQTLPSSNSV